MELNLTAIDLIRRLFIFFFNNRHTMTVNEFNIHIYYYIGCSCISNMSCCISDIDLYVKYFHQKEIKDEKFNKHKRNM